MNMSLEAALLVEELPSFHLHQVPQVSDCVWLLLSAAALSFPGAVVCAAVAMPRSV